VQILTLGSRTGRAPGRGGVDPASIAAGGPARRPRTVFGVDAFVLAAVLVPFALGLAAHLHRDRMFFPDSRYYLVMAYRDMGESATAALHTQQRVTGIPAATWYFAGSDPVWHMVQPRLLYPLLSVPFVWLAGPRWGMVAVPALSALITVVSCARLTQRLYGPTVALVAAGALAASVTVTNMAVALTDPLAVGLVSLLLLTLPIRKRMRGQDFVWLGVLSAALCMTRQTTTTMLGLAAAGAMWALLPSRTAGMDGMDKARRQWLAAAAVIAAVTVGGQAAITLFAPYDASNQFLLASHATSMSAAVEHLPRMAWQITKAEAGLMLRADIMLAVLAIGAALSVIIRFREVESWLMAGAAAGTFLLMLANGIPSFLRYESVLFPIAALCAAGLLRQWLPDHLVRDRASQSSALVPAAPLRRTAWWRGWVVALALAAVVGCGSVIAWSITHGSASLVGAVPTSPAPAAALDGKPGVTEPVRAVPAQTVLRAALHEAMRAYVSGDVGGLILYFDWRHTLRYTPAGPGDPGWSTRQGDGSAVIRYGDYVELAPVQVAAGLVRSGGCVPGSLEVSTRRVSRYGEDVTFTISDRLGHVHRGRATVLYPTQSTSLGTITELVYES
jgi:hypothetical protein